MAAVDLPPNQELLAQHNWPSLLPEQVNILRRGPGNGRLRSAGKSGAESDNDGRKQQTKTAGIHCYQSVPGADDRRKLNEGEILSPGPQFQQELLVYLRFNQGEIVLETARSLLLKPLPALGGGEILEWGFVIEMLIQSLPPILIIGFKSELD
jgi:hypothetical protein